MAAVKTAGWVGRRASTLWAPRSRNNWPPWGDSLRRCRSCRRSKICGFASHITDHGQALGHVVTGACVVSMIAKWRIVHCALAKAGLWRRHRHMGRPHHLTRSRAER